MITQSISKVLKVTLIILMAVMVFDVTWQIITRFILKNPSSYTEELAGFLLIWIGLLGASYALYTKSHLGIDILTARLTGVKRQVSEVLIYLVVLLFSFFVLVIGGIRLVNLTFTLKQISPAMGIPMGWVYMVLPLTGLLIIYYSVVFMISAVKTYGPDHNRSPVKHVDA
jgi:TRAP-type C4-dicarboxylate transport system permease small subunit